ncbi:fmn-linked oxidoreductase [Lasallia pustulata]|uniref:Fmn-linked oxidoreductase n=1 Tax=Lasallia pustulata TaxID=136370 RepID=A0A1W5DA74_9LECA|nr:fmn-linked oxidoreductase [Lasallia pustulata]
MSSHHAIPEAKEQDFSHQPIENKAAKGISYFTPAQVPPAGTASDPQPDGSHPPKLFQPLKLRGVTLQNRIMLSPLCQYSAEDGHHTAWHMTHLGGIIQRGPGLAMVEATSVTAEGRITPEDSGLWKDSQIGPLKKIVEFAHSQNQNIGIQLGHAGRKASTVAPWLSSGDLATEDVNGWPEHVYGPSPIPWNDKHAKPIEMTKSDIENFKTAWVAALKRALTAGFDVIEIHNAHGYLLHSFLSPASNKRTDEYGGSFENRTRLTLEIVGLTRQTVPEDMPVFLRISATDWLEQEKDMESWKVEDTVRLAEILADRGIDLLDVSSGGNHPLQHPHSGPGYQAPFAKAVKKKVGDKLAVATVGKITSGKQANELLEDGLDLTVVGRMFQKNPGLVWSFAEELGVQINVANQIRWGFGGRPGATEGKK